VLGTPLWAPQDPALSDRLLHARARFTGTFYEMSLQQYNF